MSSRSPLPLLAALAAILAAAPALGQTDMTAMARNSAGNELGVLEYCTATHGTDASAVAAQKLAISRLPAGGPIDAAEATGRKGMLTAPNGTTLSLSDMASRGNTTEAALCTQMAANVKTAVSDNPAMSMKMAPGAMPAMPNGMPAMPNGMPAMPNMPAAPAGQ